MDKVSLKIVTCRKRKLNSTVMDSKRPRSSVDPMGENDKFSDANDNLHEKPVVEGVRRIRPLPVPQPREIPPPIEAPEQIGGITFQELGKRFYMGSLNLSSWRMRLSL